jgi:hypothetical protein
VRLPINPVALTLKSKIMNISQALKEKNKKAANLAKLAARVITSNTSEKGTEKDYSSKKVLEETKAEMESLVQLKANIHSASAPVRHKIFRLSELKGLSKSLQYMDTHHKLHKSRTDGAVISETIPEITTKEHEAILAEMSAEIDKIQEELDAFNHTTSI